MTGMETLHYQLPGGHRIGDFEPVLVGVVASGNLEVMLEPSAEGGCAFHIETSAHGFGNIWEAVVRDFHRRHELAGVSVSVNDMGATPAVVSLRLDQAVCMLPGAPS